jgi:hypothetical protein
MMLHEIPLGSKAPHEVNAFIEIPQGTSNKIEWKINRWTWRAGIPSPAHATSSCDMLFACSGNNPALNVVFRQVERYRFSAGFRPG